MTVAWKVVGHRGFAARYPENTLPGFRAAISIGVDAVELDVQLSGDGIPVVIHDDTLDRTTTSKGALADRDFKELAGISGHYPQKYAEQFFPLPLQSLEQTCSALAELNTKVFIEIKKESIGLRGREAFLESVLQTSSILGEQRYIISFDAEILRLAKSKTQLPIGWCIEDFSEQTLAQAKDLGPAVLICDCSMPVDGKLWPGSWEWFVYGVETLAQAQYWAECGATWIEADDPPAVKCR